MFRRHFLKLLCCTPAIHLVSGKTAAAQQCLREACATAGAEVAHIRSQYSFDPERTYFNTGGLGPAPKAVLETVIRTMQQLQFDGQHGHHLIEDARPAVAAFVGCRPEELAFTRNATEGNATIASGLALQPGDEVILDSHAHQGGSLAWLARQKSEDIVVKVFEPSAESARENIARIEELITPRTRVVQVSHVTAPTGIRMPVQEIAQLAQRNGLWFHIDGAQSLGMFPFRFADLGCDSYAACCHKWVGGPHGTGILAIKHDKLDQVTPTEAGAYVEAEWDLPGTLEYVDSARRFEAGTRDAATIVAIVEAMNFLSDITMQRVEQHGLTLANFLRQQLRTLPQVQVLSPTAPELCSSMVTFQVEGKSCDEVFRTLMKKTSAAAR